ncbi:exosome complex protein LRP1 [Pseudohyphozyma bogoriensis]|nr:exosome complex protein LRP1 [Pseudohyphozyma bogoriensis]
MDPQSTLESVSHALTALTTTLSPILATPFAALAQDDDGNLDPLEKAKLQVMVAYVVHDLIYVSLKTSGVEPSTHPVMQELDRLKTYFDKLAYATNKSSGVASGSSGPRPKLDTAAASRFISAAIGSQKARVDPAYTEAPSPKGVHTRFDDAEKVAETVDKLLESGSESESDDAQESEEVERELGVVSANASPAPVSVEKKNGGEEKGKSKANRPKMDPFAGYDSPNKPGKSKSSKKKDKKRAREEAGGPTGSPVKGGSGKEGGKEGKSKKLKMKKA